MISTLDELFDLFRRKGDRHYGEDVTQTEHALQVADLARASGGDDRLVAAALLHDIGQLVDDAGDVAERERRDARHEVHGAALLAALFPPAVTEPIRLHVEAKRYLCAVEPGYRASLSDASLLSLVYQGGAMDLDARRAFEREPYFADAVRLRRFDDAGKARDRSLPDLASYRPTLLRAAR